MRIAKSIFELFLLALFALSGNAYANVNVIRLGPVATIADVANPGECGRKSGPICLMNLSQAERYCSNRGWHLPSAEEYAKVVNPNGYSKNSQPGFEKICSIPPGSDGYFDFFFYKASSYVNSLPADELWWYWTSSKFSDCRDVTIGRIFHKFDAEYGSFIRAYASDFAAVRCVEE